MAAPKTIATVTVRGQRTFFEQTRPAWQVFAVPLNGGETFPLNIEHWTVHKSDQSDAGTFELTGPLQDPLNRAYWAVGQPMDLIVIYAGRFIGGQPAGAAPVFPTLDSGIAYSAPNAATIRALGASDQTILVGMVSTVQGSQDAGQSQAFLTVTGLDLTKVLIENDISLPSNQFDAQVFFQLRSIQISTATSASQLVEDFLDAAVAKQFGSQVAGQMTAGQRQELASFSYPWRNFLITDLLDAGYLPFAPASSPGAERVFPLFQSQSGSAWSNLVELANQPMSRIFVDEVGRIVFDDALNAWTTQSPVPDALVALGQPGEVEAWQVIMDDANLSTLFSVIGSLATGVGYSVAALGGISDAQKYLTGSSTPVAAPGPTIATYGLRSTEFSALYDTLVGDAAEPVKRRIFAVLQLLHNSMIFCNVRIRGRALRVGTRVRLTIPHVNPALQDATWYVCSYDHEGTISDDGGWTTNVALRFPQPTVQPPDDTVGDVTQ